MSCAASQGAANLHPPAALQTACSYAETLLPLIASLRKKDISAIGMQGLICSLAVPDATCQEVSHYRCCHPHLSWSAENLVVNGAPSVRGGWLAWWWGRWSRGPPRPRRRGDGRRRPGCRLGRCSRCNRRRQRLRLGSGDDLLDAGAELVHRGLHVGVQHAADVSQHIQQPCMPAAPQA